MKRVKRGLFGLSNDFWIAFNAIFACFDLSMSFEGVLDHSPGNVVFFGLSAVVMLVLAQLAWENRQG